MPKQYSVGWITVPGKGKRWRTADGTYLMQRPAGDALAGAGQFFQGLMGQLNGTPLGRYAQTAASMAVPGLMTFLGGRAQEGMMRGAVALSRSARNQVDGNKLQAAFERRSGEGRRTAVVNPLMRGSLTTLSNVPPSQYANVRHQQIQSGQDLFGVAFGVETRTPQQLVDLSRRMPGVYRQPSELEPRGSVNAPPVAIENGQWRYSGGIMAHEMGHALDYNTPRGRALLRARARTSPQLAPGAMTGSVGVGGHRDDRSLGSAAIEGALGSLLTPQARSVLESEHRANRFGRELAKEAGTPWSRTAERLAMGTYANALGLPGAVQGVTGELLSRGADQVAAWAVDRLDDVTGRSSPQRPLSWTEQALQQYGYAPDKYKFRADPGGNNSLRVLPR